MTEKIGRASCRERVEITKEAVSSRRRHTRFSRDWSSDVCSSDLQNNMDEIVNDIYTYLSEKRSLEDIAAYCQLEQQLTTDILAKMLEEDKIIFKPPYYHQK